MARATVLALDIHNSHSHMYAKKEKKYPDFVIVNATWHLDADIMILIVKVKTGKASWSAARSQLKKYC
jgi:hypothetical protein